MVSECYEMMVKGVFFCVLFLLSYIVFALYFKHCQSHWGFCFHLLKKYIKLVALEIKTFEPSAPPQFCRTRDRHWRQKVTSPGYRWGYGTNKKSTMAGRHSTLSGLSCLFVFDPL